MAWQRLLTPTCRRASPEALWVLQAQHIPAILESLAAAARYPDDSVAYEAAAGEAPLSALALLLISCIKHQLCAIPQLWNFCSAVLAQLPLRFWADCTVLSTILVCNLANLMFAILYTSWPANFSVASSK